MDGAEAELVRRIRTLEQQTTVTWDAAADTAPTADVDMYPTTNADELPSIEELFPPEAVAAVSADAWTEVLQAISPFFSLTSLAQIGELREEVVMRVASGDLPRAPVSADATTDDAERYAEHHAVAGGGHDHSMRRSDRRRQDKSGWDSKKSRRPHWSKTEMAEDRAYNVCLGEPGTAKARQSIRDIQQWLDKAPSTKKPKRVYPSSHADSGVTDAAVQEAVQVRVAQLLQGAGALKSSFAALAIFLEKQAAQISKHFAQTANRYCATIPTLIKPLNVSQSVKKAYTNNAATSQVAWHGTRAHNVSAIKDHGLLIPGPRNMPGQISNRPTVPVARGQAYGRGVYASATPSMAAGYAGAEGSLLMCAVKRGGANRFGEIMVVEHEANILPL